MNEWQKMLADFRIIDEIISMLPDDEHEALLILAMCVNDYSIKHNMDPDTVWTILYNGHLAVRKDLGPYPGKEDTT